MASSSSSGGGRKYDVFLSFRGEDTRKIFVGHLYRALQRSIINAYIDSEDLDKGNRISELLIAIEDSRISIVVLSQNYASSKWCLKELAKIMDCRDNKKQIVVPIFYEVDPSDVRNIKGTFAQAFVNHEANSQLAEEDLESWRLALTRVADLSGWDSRKYEDDAKLIEEVVESTLRKLTHTSSIKASGGLVGMDFHIAQMYSRLCLEVNDVRVVGIWGMGGLGKTTIAKAVYSEIASKFEHPCFVHNVKDKHEAEVQKELLFSLLKEKGKGIDLQRGRDMIMERLSTRKVLIVLDDVENFSQIKELLGEPHAFGKGSRIIVTTRDQQSPKEVNETYHPKCLNQKNSGELFVKHAFGTDQPSEEYNDLLNQAIEYAHGLPLALKVLGASLYDKNIHQWKDLLEKIKIIPERKIMDVLRISFKGLDVLEQQIFLDIACFFREWDHLEVTEILHDFHSHIGLQNLVNRSLVTINGDGELDMHDLLQEMGREIVRREYPNRLWSFEDVDKVLTQNTDADAIECLMLELPYDYEDGTYCINFGAFARMTKLRVLIINRDRYPYEQVARGKLEFLSDQLRLLQWIRCPLQSLPNTFIPKNLVRLDMSYSDIQQLWEGTKPLQNLKVIRLTDCRSLVKIPDLTKAIHLKKLYLDYCLSLLELHSSISALQELEYLTLKGCEQLKILPSSLHMKSLETLDLSWCSNLEKFPEISDAMSELQKLDLCWTAIKELPESINNLTGLRVLNLSYCRQLTTLPSSIHLSSLRTLDLTGSSNLKNFPEISDVMSELQELHLAQTAIKELPESINNLTGLRVLNLSYCRQSIHLSSLRTLDLTGSSNLKNFPEISDVMSELQELHLAQTAIKELPESINNLTGLRVLNLSHCKELTTLPSSIHLSSLRKLHLIGCSNLEKFPEISDVMSELQELHLAQTAIKELPKSINNLTGLLVLDLQHCRQLTTLPSSIHLSSLRTLDLNCSSNLKNFPEISDAMSELQKLDLCWTAIKELPESINNLTGLRVLNLSYCRQLTTLPSSIHLSSLRKLHLFGCSNLEKFPEISDVMSELQELHLAQTAIKELPKSINNLTGLLVLDLQHCRQLTTLPSSIHQSSLRTLDLTGSSNLKNFPEISNVMSELQELHLAQTAIKELPESINNLTGLRVLNLSHCKELTTLPSSIHLSSFRKLHLIGCSNLEKFPEISDVMSELQELHLAQTAIKELPKSINNLTGLLVLDLQHCRQLTTLPSSIHLSSLRTLDLTGSSNLKNFPEISGIMKELQTLDLAFTAIKELPESINNLSGFRVLNLSYCRQLTTLPSSIHLSSLRKLDLIGCSNLEKFPEISGIMKELSELVLDETAIKGLPSSIDMLKGIKKLSMRNCKSLECLPDSICNLAQLTHLDLEGCNRLKSIPELSSINRLNAHCCTALETVSTPKIVCTDLDFTFSNCRQLVQTNLFTNIVETCVLDQDIHPPPLSCYMCFSGSEIPNWFSHQSRASSVTVQLPPNWFDKMFLGFAICAVSCFNDPDPIYSYQLVARCYCTFKGNQGEHNFRFQLQDWDFTSQRSLESDHMFMAYVPWSKFSLAEKEEPVNERYYTEATFKIVVESIWNERHCMTKYGVRFFHGSYMDGQNERMTNTTIPAEGLGVPFFPDQLEIRKTVTEWEAESTETAAERGTYQILESLPERKEEEVIVAAAQVDGPRVLGSVCCCLSLSGCSCIMSSSDRNRKRRRQSI